MAPAIPENSRNLFQLKIALGQNLIAIFDNTKRGRNVRPLIIMLITGFHTYERSLLENTEQPAVMCSLRELKYKACNKS